MTDSLLVISPFEETWGDHQPLIFLGEWCKLYQRADVWGARQSKTVSYHWDDRHKLRADYDDLSRLHARVLDGLVGGLNRVHRIERSTRYWQILLDPWLMAFVGTIYDRWECLRAAFATHAIGATKLFRSETEPASFSYSEYIRESSYSDQWNHDLFARILGRHFAGRCRIEWLEPGPRTRRVTQRPSTSWRQAALRGAATIESMAQSVLRGRVVFIDSYFSVGALVRLSLALGQLPRLLFTDSQFSVAGGLEVTGPSRAQRRQLDLQFTAENEFEACLATALVDYLPTCVLEHFEVLRQRAKAVRLKPDIVVTALSQWSNPLAKAWMAEQVHQGVKLVVHEHGGSLPAYRENFWFDEDIADVKGTWFLPYHAKHVQVPPSKLARGLSATRTPRPRNKVTDVCLVIAYDQARYANRAHFYPIGAQTLRVFELAASFQEAVAPPVRSLVRFRPHPSDQGWNMRQRFVDRFGAACLSQERRLEEACRCARIVVSMYPETTFTEAVHSGRPALLLYPAELFERHLVAQPLIDTMRAAQIIFHDAKEAADHVSCIWDDVDGWWKSQQVVQARAMFQEQAMSLDAKWVANWRAFLEGALLCGNVPTSSTGFTHL